MPHVCAAILQGHLYLLHHHVNGSPSLVLTRLPSAVVSTSQFELYRLSHVPLFAAPWTAAHQASLSFTISRSLLTTLPPPFTGFPSRIN